MPWIIGAFVVVWLFLIIAAQRGWDEKWEEVANRDRKEDSK